MKETYLPVEVQNKRPDELLDWAGQKWENWHKFEAWIRETIKIKEAVERQRGKLEIRN